MIDEWWPQLKKFNPICDQNKQKNKDQKQTMEDQLVSCLTLNQNNQINHARPAFVKNDIEPFTQIWN